MPFLDASPIRTSYEVRSLRRSPKPIESYPVRSKPAEVPTKPAEVPAEVPVQTWAEHVKRTREESGGTLKEVLKRAKETYKK